MKMDCLMWSLHLNRRMQCKTVDSAHMNISSGLWIMMYSYNAVSVFAIIWISMFTKWGRNIFKQERKNLYFKVFCKLRVLSLEQQIAHSTSYTQPYSGSWEQDRIKRGKSWVFVSMTNPTNILNLCMSLYV